MQLSLLVCVLHVHVTFPSASFNHIRILHKQQKLWTNICKIFSITYIFLKHNVSENGPTSLNRKCMKTTIFGLLERDCLSPQFNTTRQRKMLSIRDCLVTYFVTKPLRFTNYNGLVSPVQFYFFRSKER
jgi:hypothetical protein